MIFDDSSDTPPICNGCKNDYDICSFCMAWRKKPVRDDLIEGEAICQDCYESMDWKVCKKCGTEFSVDDDSSTDDL